MEEATKNNAAMILRLKGKRYCFGCDNDKQPLLKLADGVASFHVSSRRCKITIQ